MSIEQSPECTDVNNDSFADPQDGKDEPLPQRTAAEKGGLIISYARILVGLFEASTEAQMPVSATAIREAADNLRGDNKKTSHGALRRAMERLIEIDWVEYSYSSEERLQRPMVLYSLTEEGRPIAQDYQVILALHRESQELEQNFERDFGVPAIAPHASV